jgi:hypothetical protein
MSKSQAMIYKAEWIKPQEKEQILGYLRTLHPIWEMRYSKNNPPPPSEPNRQLLRPVYWLGNWQFACLNYYHPPKGIYNRCVRAEGFPPVLEQIIHRIEEMVHAHYQPRDIPHGWEMNTCLINFYGSKLINGKWEDVARVGEHKDFEPGPVASISFGEKAFFQFVSSSGKGAQSQVVMSQWLEDSCLQIFGGDRFKKHLFHRVQRVEKKGTEFDFKIPNFKTRRINFTFRYVPRDHFVDFSHLPVPLQEDVKPYVMELAEHSKFFQGCVSLF